MSYAMDFRLRVVGEFRASGLTYREACDRFPHFPSRHTLSDWDRAFLRDGVEVPVPEVRGRVEHRKHQRYPEATRREALRLLRAGETARAVGARLGVPTGTVDVWARKARGRGTRPAEGARPMAVGRGRAGERPYAEVVRENDELRLQVRALVAMMGDPKSAGPAKGRGRRLVAFGERPGRERGCSLRSLTTSLRISRSTWEYERRALARPDPDAWPGERVRADFAASGRTYGYRRPRAEIAGGLDGLPARRVSEKRVLRAMRELSLAPRRRGTAPYSSYAGETDGRPANVPPGRAAARRAAGEDFGMAHDFSAERPGQLAVTDVTEFRLGSSEAYLSPVIDCFDGMPAAWSISAHPDSELCDSSLAAYLGSLPEGHGPLVAHTDGGSCHGTASWKALCAGAGVTRSMSRKATCADNARAEGFFGTLKREFLYGTDWAGVTFGEFRDRLDGYLRWYRDVRLKAFDDGKGGVRYETIAGRRRRLGYAI
jgi:transposase InsO family protein/transposase-like protein